MSKPVLSARTIRRKSVREEVLLHQDSTCLSRYAFTGISRREDCT